MLASKDMSIAIMKKENIFKKSRSSMFSCISVEKIKSALNIFNELGYEEFDYIDIHVVDVPTRNGDEEGCLLYLTPMGQENGIVISPVNKSYRDEEIKFIIKSVDINE